MCLQLLPAPRVFLALPQLGLAGFWSLVLLGGLPALLGGFADNAREMQALHAAGMLLASVVVAGALLAGVPPPFRLAPLLLILVAALLCPLDVTCPTTS